MQTIYYFKNKTHAYKLIESDYGNRKYIRVGTSQFRDCIEINIEVPSELTAEAEAEAKIIQIKSEPECGYYKMITEAEINNTVNMIKSTLQFISSKYPFVKRYIFDDGSTIECMIEGSKSKRVQKPPRRIYKPFSLSHLSIALYGKTWYERHFNAKMLDSVKYEAYRKLISRLDDESYKIDFDIFRKKYLTNEETINEIREYYLKAKTYSDFFTSIPKSKYCSLFFNWLPLMIDDILENINIFRNWYIDINRMDKTEMTEVAEEPNMVGAGKHKNKSRKLKKRNIFTNDMRYRYTQGIYE